MKCPLFVMTASRVERAQGIAYIDCLKEECAWWNGDANMCAILHLDVDLFVLAIVLRNMQDKMPSPEFFKK